MSQLMCVEAVSERCKNFSISFYIYDKGRRRTRGKRYRICRKKHMWQGQLAVNIDDFAGRNYAPLESVKIILQFSQYFCMHNTIGGQVNAKR